MIRAATASILLLLVCIIPLSFAAQTELSSPASVTGIVIKNANLRDAPSLEGNIIGSAPAGTTLVILDERGNWYNVQNAQGLVAWIYKPLLNPLPVPEPPTTESSVSTVEPSLPSPAPGVADVPPPAPAPAPESPPLSLAPPTSKEATLETPLETPKEPEATLRTETAPGPSTPQPSSPAEPPPLSPPPPPPSPAPSSLVSYYFSTGHIFLLLFLILFVLLGLLLIQYRTIRELRHFVRILRQSPQGAAPENYAPLSSSSPFPTSSTDFSPLEKAIVEVLREKGEVPEEILMESLREKGFTPALLKATVAEMIGKTKEQETPLIKIRYAGNRYFYSLHSPVSV